MPIYTGGCSSSSYVDLSKHLSRVQQLLDVAVDSHQVLPCFGCAAAGATGGVGKRVVQQLLAQGRVVRALVRDVEKAKQLLVSHMCGLYDCVTLRWHAC
jgi:hypothetical protein